MLSILIPVYHYDVRSLVHELHQQSTNLKIPFEILVFDDASGPETLQWNQSLSHLQNTTFKQLPHNLGRSKIRNLLAASANYEYLLFIDGDSSICSQTYIEDYIKNIKYNSVLVGKTSYSKSRPDNITHLLRWTFGRSREMTPAIQRQQNPYHAFKTHHVLIPKTVFNQIPFDESITGYGHEDSLYGIQLKEQGFPIIHLDNPLNHEGLESTALFIQKIENSIQNLCQINSPETVLETKLWLTYMRVRKLGISYILNKCSNPILRICSKNLQSNRPLLFVLDLYKLTFLCTICPKKRK